MDFAQHLVHDQEGHNQSWLADSEEQTSENASVWRFLSEEWISFVTLEDCVWESDGLGESLGFCKVGDDTEEDAVAGKDGCGDVAGGAELEDSAELACGSSLSPSEAQFLAFSLSSASEQDIKP